VDADSPLDHVFFPTAVSSRPVRFMQTAAIIEMATIGREGCTAVQAAVGAKSSSVRLLVQIPGDAAKMFTCGVHTAMGSMPSFQHLMYAYVQAFSRTGPGVRSVQRCHTASSSG